ncbi:MAG: hypothetical protein H7145_01270 [Akkermansiaceae bacterium]|nr:hypothetical protein [Armatimonadota bacterium]
MNTTIDNESTTAPQNSGTLTIEGKRFGRGAKALFPNFQMPLPEAWQNGITITVRDLLDTVVRTEVAAFQTRQEARTVLQTLSPSQIAEGVAKGKIDSGGREDERQPVDADESVRVALQAFEDGLYYVLINDDQKASLTDSFAVTPETRVTFLRLVALAGG